jgi:hypothetical protein
MRDDWMELAEIAPDLVSDPEYCALVDNLRLE